MKRLTDDSWKPDIYVLARVIDLLYTCGPLKKTNAQMKSGINYVGFIRYLDWMKAHGIVELHSENDGVELLHLTTKGVEAYRILVEWLQATLNESTSNGI